MLASSFAVSFSRSQLGVPSRRVGACSVCSISNDNEEADDDDISSSKSLSCRTQPAGCASSVESIAPDVRPRILCCRSACVSAGMISSKSSCDSSMT